MFSRLRNNSKTKVNGFNLYTYVKRNKYVYSNALSLYIQMHFLLISKKKKKKKKKLVCKIPDPQPD